MQPALNIESFGDLTVTEAEVAAIAAAHETFCDQIMPEPSAALAEAATDDPAAAANVVGVGVGVKTTHGVATGRPALIVFVRKKVPPDELAAATSIPATVGGVETDVVATGEIVASQFRDLHRPAPGGVSIGNCLENAAGTLGCWVDSEKALCILSNNHVMARSNAGAKGEPISQPGRLDHGVCPDNVIAELLRFIEIDFAGGINQVDAAIASATDLEFADGRILRGKQKYEGLASPEVAAGLGMKVQKSGRTTGWTHGSVDAVAVTVNVRYPGDRIGRFENQFRVSAAEGNFSEPGDSGSDYNAVQWRVAHSLDDRNSDKIRKSLMSGSVIISLYEALKEERGKKNRHERTGASHRQGSGQP